MNTKNIIALAICIVAIFALSSCMKDWLDVKPNKKLVVPNTLKDLQALLDNSLGLNRDATSSLVEVMADDFYVTDAQWAGYTRTRNKNAYLWKNDIFEGADDLSWSAPYQKIYYANTVIEGINKLNPHKGEVSTWSNILGSALFFRGENFFTLVEMFADVYDSSNAGNKLGLPLKLESDINISPKRATVSQTYKTILEDIKKASLLLPDKQEIQTRPSRESAFGLLARIYLQMEDFDNALLYADSCLMLNDKLIDYNTLNLSISFPFKRHNEEVIFSSSMQRDLMLIDMAHIVPELFNSYSDSDLRKIGFFNISKNQIAFKGSYEGETTMFSGIARDEIYLIRSECYARLGRPADALKDLNTLLINRYRTGEFSEINGIEGIDLLKIILLERRKELVFRARRWSDLRRLNKDPQFTIEQSRIIGGQEYKLPPQDSRYTFPIPDNVIRLSGIAQNQR